MKTRIASFLVVSLLVSTVVPQPALAERRLGTIGPPPRENPQRVSNAESMPPLPLPVVPLRRSEPKSEPRAPTFAGKLTYGSTQDYMPNPGDLENLMRQMRYQLGVWYSQKVVKMEDLVAGFKKGRPSRIPLLYITGYEAFSLSADERAALRDYLVSGGSVFADATLGSPAFTRSFITEVKAMFPKRRIHPLPLDHPVFRAYYPYANVHTFDVEGGPDQASQGPPELIGMNLGTRAAVLFSPLDMSCGFDEFYAPDSSVKVPDAPRDRALVPGDAVRLGVNICSYVAAMREVAATEAVTRRIEAAPDRPRQAFTLAQLRHNGDWNPDPNSVVQWLRVLSGESSLSVDFALHYVDAQETQLAPHPFLYMTGFQDPELGDEEIMALRRHLDAGGFLFVNNSSGYATFDKHARALAKRLFPDQDLSPVDAAHPLFTSFYSLSDGRDRVTGAERPLEFEGISVNDRLVLVYSRNDVVGHLKQVSDPFGNGYDANTCREAALNLVAYSMQY